MPKTKNPLTKNEKLIHFIESEIKNIASKRSHTYSVINYMKYREFSTIDELLKSAEKEIPFLLEFQEINKTTRIAASHIRRFLRFYGAKIKIERNSGNKKNRFNDDMLMQSWKNYYSNKGTTDNVIRALTNFCVFHETTPSELKQNADKKLFSKGIIKSMLKNYYEARIKKVQHKVAWTEVNYVKIFFREFLDIEFQWRRQDIPKTNRGIMSEEDFELENFKESIQKDDFKAMLYHGNLFERAVLHTLWSSGLSNIDACRLQYKSFKNLIDPFNPKELTEEFYLFHHVRSKTKIGFYGVISKKALELIQSHLRKQYHYTDSINDETYIFTSFYSKKRIYPATIRRITTKLVKLSEIENNITPSHFRKTFYRKCREEARMDQTIVEIIMGHWRENGSGDDSSVMSDFHYGDRKSFYEKLKSRIISEMQKCIDMRLFDLEKDDLKYMQLEQEMNDEISLLKESNRILRDEFRELREFSKQESPEKALLESFSELSKKDLLKLLQDKLTEKA